MLIDKEVTPMNNKKFDANDTDRRYDFADLCEIIAQLRAPGGCPVSYTHLDVYKRQK